MSFSCADVTLSGSSRPRCVLSGGNAPGKRSETAPTLKGSNWATQRMAFTISAPAFLRQPLFRAPVIDPFRVKPTGVPAFRGRCPRLLYESPSGIRGHHDPHAGTTLGLRCLSSPRDPGLTSGSVACRHAPDGPNLDAHSPLIAGSHRVMPSGSEVVIACAVLLKNVAARPLSPNLVFHNVPRMRAARSP